MILRELQEWRKREIGSQDALAEKIGRDQNAVSRYERGGSPIPEDVVIKLRELGYNGPVELPGAPNSLGEIDFKKIHAEAESIVQEIEASAKKAMPATLRAELVSLAGEEVQDAFRAGKPEQARERILRWWALIRGTR